MTVWLHCPKTSVIVKLYYRSSSDSRTDFRVHHNSFPDLISNVQFLQSLKNYTIPKSAIPIKVYSRAGENPIFGPLSSVISLNPPTHFTCRISVRQATFNVRNTTYAIRIKASIPAFPSLISCAPTSRSQSKEFHTL